jgi:hypothetical protein
VRHHYLTLLGFFVFFFHVLKFLICICFVFLLNTLKALCRAEDEEDIRAATQAKAEQVAELAEFNENDGFPAGEGEEANRPGPGAEDEEMSRAEQEIAALVEQVRVGSTTTSLHLSSLMYARTPFFFFPPHLSW